MDCDLSCLVLYSKEMELMMSHDIICSRIDSIPLIDFFLLNSGFKSKNSNFKAKTSIQLKHYMNINCKRFKSGELDLSISNANQRRINIKSKSEVQGSRVKWKRGPKLTPL